MTILLSIYDIFLRNKLFKYKKCDFQYFPIHIHIIRYIDFI